MKRRNLILAVAAVCLLQCASIKTAMAYFSVSIRSEGHTEVKFSEHTEIKEDFDSWTKKLIVSYDGDDNGQVYVRARGFAPEEMTLTYSGDRWTDGGDGYWYYDGYIGNTEDTKATTVLNVEINNVPADAKAGDSFNVVVIYETTPVQYDSDGSMIAAAEADWNTEVKIND
ncbi:MAG: hypothetical protein IJI75_11600 [Solobacterium sp.]|nr:hypothetical protein [Solobacterium sp.]